MLIYVVLRTIIRNSLRGFNCFSQAASILLYINLLAYNAEQFIVQNNFGLKKKKKTMLIIFIVIHFVCRFLLYTGK